MRFIADSMLGRLARWLRLLGYDTVYSPHIEDSLLLRIARQDNRILLTRDTGIVKVRGLRKFLLLDENDSFKQLKKVITILKLCPYNEPNANEKPPVLSRCPLCNTPLRNISKEETKGFVPEYVYLTCDSFKYCSKCDKFYWKGTHPERLRKKLLEVLYNN